MHRDGRSRHGYNRFVHWAKEFDRSSTLDPNGRDFGDEYTNLEHYVNGTNPVAPESKGEHRDK